MQIPEHDLPHIERVTALIEHFKARYADPAIAAIAALAVIHSTSSAATVRPEVFTVAEAAERLKVDPRTVYRLCESGDIACIKVGAGKKRPTLRITAVALDTYQNSSVDGESPHVFKHLRLGRK